jgi:thiamine kinase-like enzyme
MSVPVITAVGEVDVEPKLQTNLTKLSSTAIEFMGHTIPNSEMAAAAITQACEAFPALAGDGAFAEKLTGGISNTMYRVNNSDLLCESVLVRIYGSGEPLCERTSEESLVQQLSDAGVGPRIHSTFGHGRVEEFLSNRRPLLSVEALSPDFAAMVAVQVAQLHELALKIPGRATAEQQLHRWLTACPAGGSVDTGLLAVAIGGVARLRPTAVSKEEQVIERILLGRSLCHLDLFASNLLLSDNDIRLIDFEYAAEAPIGLDIANHISGKTEIINGSTVSFKTDMYPGPEAQLHFLSAYLAARKLPPFIDPAASQFVLRLLVAFAAEAELRWVTWGLLQAKLSAVSFDYGDYAAQRWRCYGTYKQWLEC